MDKKVFSATIIYSVLAFLQPLASFLLLPLYLHFFDADEYGILNLMNTYSGLLALTGSFGITGAFLTFFFDYHKEEAKLNKFLGQVLSFSLYTTLFFSVLLLVFGEPLFKVLFKNKAILYHPYGLIATLTGLAMCIEEPFRIYLRNKQQLLKYAGIVLLNLIISVLIQIVLIVIFDWGIKGALTGRLCGVAINAIIVILWNRKHLSFKLDWSFLEKPLKFMRYFLPSTFVRWTYRAGDRFLVERLLSLAQVGLYGLLSTLIQMVELVYFSIRTAIVPQLSAAYILPNKERKKQLSELYNYYFLLSTLAVFGIIMVVGNLHLVIKNPEYLEIRRFANLFAPAYFFSSITHLLYYEFYFYKNSKTVLNYTLLSVILMVGLNLILLPKLQLWGAVIAAFVSRFIVFLVMKFKNEAMFAPLGKKIYALLGLSLLTISITEILTRYYSFNFSYLSIFQFLLMLGIIVLLNKNLLLKRIR